MGKVYKARDTRLNRTVAIKVLHERLSQNPELKARFKREAQSIAALNHPHICTLYDVGQQGGIDYFVMEFLNGETLAQRLERGSLTVHDALQIAIGITGALDRTHREHIVHRDLKPSNIMLTPSGTKLLDFGLVKLRQAEEAEPEPLINAPTRRAVTEEGTILGTLEYMAPEQLEGKKVDARADIWAIGCILFEMLTGDKAFTGQSSASVIAAIMSYSPPPILSVKPTLPPLLDRVVQKCLSKNAEDRW